MSRPVGRAGAVTAAVAAGALVLTACTSAPSNRPSASGPTPSVPAPTTPATGPSGPSSTPASTTTAPSTPATTPAGSPTATALPRDYCAASALSVRAINGSGGGGRQYALILFTNSGATACSLSGFPGVSLLANGRSVATAGRTGAVGGPVRLAPGGKAQATVVDSSTCQAALSDTLRVYPPNLSVYFESPIQLRGCALTVGSVQPA